MPELYKNGQSLSAIQTARINKEKKHQTQHPRVCKTTAKFITQDGKYFVSIRCVDGSSCDKIITIEKIFTSCIQVEAWRALVKIIIWKFSKDGKRAAAFIATENDCVDIPLGRFVVDDIEYDVQLSKSFVSSTATPRCTSSSESTMSALTDGTAKPLPRRPRNMKSRSNRKTTMISSPNVSNTVYLSPPAPWLPPYSGCMSTNHMFSNPFLRGGIASFNVWIPPPINMPFYYGLPFAPPFNNLYLPQFSYPNI